MQTGSIFTLNHPMICRYQIHINQIFWDATMESFTFFTRITNGVLVTFTLCICLVVFLFSAEWILPEMHGSSHIGNGLYLN